MSSIRFALLSLLAREPLSGYDMKQQLDGRINIFYKINNNQLYPNLSKLRDEGLIELQSYEKASYRPARKVYKITEEGIEKLKLWVMEPSAPGAWDEFLLKQYSGWLVDPEVMLPQVEEKRKEHEKRLEEYKDKIDTLKKQHSPLTSNEPFFSSIAVLEMGIGFERSSVEWCEKIIGWLKENKMS